MSRIGRMPIKVPDGVKVKITDNLVVASGPKGELTRTLNGDMTIKMENETITVSRPSDKRIHREMHGLTRSLLANMVTGVSAGFEKSLEIVGVGYRAQKQDDKLVFRVGFSHPVEITPLPGITLTAESPIKVKVSGADKEVVGQMAAEIRAIRPPDVYKGKGIRYAGEYIKLKPGKAGKAIGGV